MPQPEHPHADYIRRLVDAAPPLSEAQRSRLATILRPAVARPALAVQAAAARPPRGVDLVDLAGPTVQEREAEAA